MEENDDRIEDKHFISALKNVQRISGLQGWFQKINTNPITTIDCAHNPAGIQGLWITFKLQTIIL